MRRLVSTLALVLSCVWILAVASTGWAVTELTGFTAGAHYRILKPDDTDLTPWNGDLVIWNHGFSLSPIGPVSDMGPLVDVQLSEGYAVAASSFQQPGWAVFKTNNDLREMIDVFKANFGTPNAIIVTGASSGGAVTAAALEKGNLGNVVGAMPICGALAGSRNWDGGTDVRLIYDVFCKARWPVPGGAMGLPTREPLTDVELGTATTVCFGVPFTSPDPFAPLRRLQWVIATQLPESFLIFVHGFAINGLADLVHDPAKLDGKIGVITEGVAYSDPLIEAKIERVTPNPGAANRLGRHYTPNGNVRGAKIISLHTDLDGLVIVENEKEYADVVPASNLTTAVVVEEFPSHCGFNEAEVVASWESLRGWLGTGEQPSAAEIQGTCEFFEANGLAAGPCRIAASCAADPSEGCFQIPDMDGRIPPR